ncbi:hypothetical protein [Comamonas sp.]|uniref:hypothetical protein n=1 Tax=Comamonas sp. TaxID=34028 RepID=UPI0028992F72|nr:hypothetical protein [Comamonas sp.]
MTSLKNTIRALSASDGKRLKAYTFLRVLSSDHGGSKSLLIFDGFLASAIT